MFLKSNPDITIYLLNITMVAMKGVMAQIRLDENPNKSYGYNLSAHSSAG